MVYSTKIFVPVVTPAFIFDGFKDEQPPDTYRIANFLAVISGYLLAYYVFFSGVPSNGILALVYFTKSNAFAAFIVGLLGGVLLLLTELRSDFANLAHAPAVFVLTFLLIPGLDFTLWSSPAFVIASFAKVFAVCIILWLRNFYELRNQKRKTQNKTTLNTLFEKRR